MPARARFNEYHVLARRPQPSDKPLAKHVEAMAQALVTSGRLYINADTMRNFVHYTTATTTYSFSARELTDPALCEHTKTLIARSIPKGLGPVAVNERIDQLLRDLKKGRGIAHTLEIRVARLIVQAAHEAVIRTLIRERTQVFVSFSHNVSDLMAVHFWQDHGGSGGLQSTSDSGAAVYISCGGDPFFEGKEGEKYYTTDGAQALSRMLVIGAQELGHYADLIRSSHGISGRHSARMQPLRASPKCKAARDADLARVQTLAQHYANAGLGALVRAEEAVKFYEKQKQNYAPLWLMAQLKRLVCWWRFSRRAASLPLRFRATHPRLTCGAFYQSMLRDMAFNLAPEADAYRRADAQEEEAIACIEALARVPQQEIKWGREATHTCWPSLAAFYEDVVLSSLPSG